MIEVIFWGSAAFVFYTYVGYPGLLVVWRALRRRPVRKAAWEPHVSLVIAAWNERERIGDKIDNCLALDYPPDRLQVIVALDGPTDGTEAVVRAYTDRGVHMVHSPRHRGKAATLNDAVDWARGEILVFADARQQMDPRAIRELVANFIDPTVGSVSGELLLEDADDSSSGPGLYWRYEKKLRALESDIHSMLGATGALYAIRRELYRPIPGDTILDDVAIPMAAVLAGQRAIFEPAARVYDRAAPSSREYDRKVRTLLGNYQILSQMPEILDPRRNPVFLQYLSHKVARLLVPYFLMAALASNLLLFRGIYLLTLAGQCLVYLAAWAGWRIARRGAVTGAAAT